MGKKRILIVDDETSFTRLVKLNLEQAGDYEILIENNGRAALTAAQTFKPDVIVLDIIMPEIDGGDVATQFQTDSNLRTVPIIFLTATVKKQEVEARKGLIGGFSFVAKPASTRDLVIAIENHLKTKE
jgi:CheY-like chemotaxis protein